jgi:hypothetical protein
MPFTFRTARLWTLVTVVILAVATGTALRAVQPQATPMAAWPQSPAI